MQLSVQLQQRFPDLRAICIYLATKKLKQSGLSSQSNVLSDQHMCYLLLQSETYKDSSKSSQWY